MERYVPIDGEDYIYDMRFSLKSGTTSEDFNCPDVLNVFMILQTSMHAFSQANVDT